MQANKESFKKILLSLQDIIPKFNQFQHKGRNGRIGVIGGCQEYTGAPYYSAISLLKGGADLAHIFCTQSAAVPIKSYSPEIIVHPYLYAEDQLDKLKLLHPNDYSMHLQYQKGQIEQTIKNMASWYQALHSFVIGPGIGRDKHITEYMPKLIDNMEQGQIIILDADGLWFLSHGNPEQMKQSILKKPSDIILTPNQAEFERLWVQNFPEEHVSITRDQKQKLYQERHYENLNEIIEVPIDDPYIKDTVKLSQHYNNVNIIHKGAVDVITNGKQAFIVAVESSKKRCGGIGDILTGLTSLYAYWGKIHNKEDNMGVLLGCVLGSYITRCSSKNAYNINKFSLTAPNIIECVGPAFNTFYEAKL